jgi:transposase
MIQVSPTTRVLVAIEPIDGRKGIDGLAQLCRSVLSCDPMSGTLVVFRNRSAKTIKLLQYDGQGFWLCTKRMSCSRFKHWPAATDSTAASRELLAHELHALLMGGDPNQAQAAPMWRRVNVAPGARVS